MNGPALLATAFFAVVLLAVVGSLYGVAVRAHRRGELGLDGVALLRWAIAGQLVLYVILALTAFFSTG
jgi:hypothetical protein